MNACNHSTLELLPEKEKRVRCRCCHLTLPRKELEGGYCPECYETSGAKHYTFDEIDDPKESVSRYRCEQCGAIVRIP